MQSGYSDESGSLMFGILLVVGILFVLFWGIQYALLQEWYLFRKKSAWVEKLDMTKVDNLYNLPTLHEEIVIKNVTTKYEATKHEVITDVVEKGVKKSSLSSVNCNLYQQKADIRASKQWGYHQLKMVNPCYSDYFAQLQVDYHLTAVTDHQVIVHSQYRYEANLVQKALSSASLVEFSKVDDENIKVTVEYERQDYTYFLPCAEVGDVEQYQLVAGVIGEGQGVALIINQRLWLLPFAKGQTPKVKDLPFTWQSIWVAAIVDPISNSGEIAEGLYLLIQDHRSQLQLYWQVLSQNIWQKLGEWSIAFNEIAVDSNISSWQLGGWQLLHLDHIGLVLQLENKSWLKAQQKLLAISWDGAPLWGNKPIWMRKDTKKGDCGLQQQLFEPINGWPLGCQRLRIGKMMVE